MQRTIRQFGAIFLRLCFLDVGGGCVLLDRSFGVRVLWERGEEIVLVAGFKLLQVGVTFGRKAERCRHMHILAGAAALLDGVSAILIYVSEL